MRERRALGNFGLLGASSERLDLTDNDDTFDISLLSSDSATRASFSAGYYIPLIFPDLLSVGTERVTPFMMQLHLLLKKWISMVPPKSLNMWLDRKPLATESTSNQSLSFRDRSHSWKLLEASNSFLSGEGTATGADRLYLKVETPT